MASCYTLLPTFAIFPCADCCPIYIFTHRSQYVSLNLFIVEIIPWALSDDKSYRLRRDKQHHRTDNRIMCTEEKAVVWNQNM
ncbi:hypothetical protein F5Y19DRAFT_423826 [Xylariaceae sp. FL1651]|nr:hypothetical protein F5Y19DRAFT_423826 [Xylariaceae sp. FL1651]